MLLRRFPFAILPLILIAQLGCGDPALAPVALQGTYVLESSRGGAAEGTVVLSWFGDVVRRVRYARQGGDLTKEYVARGTYRLGDGRRLELHVREDDGRSPYVWKPGATINGSVLTLRFPHPADGPDIIEAYRRE